MRLFALTSIAILAFSSYTALAAPIVNTSPHSRNVAQHDRRGLLFNSDEVALRNIEAKGAGASAGDLAVAANRAKNKPHSDYHLRLKKATGTDGTLKALTGAKISQVKARVSLKLSKLKLVKTKPAVTTEPGLKEASITLGDTPVEASAPVAPGSPRRVPSKPLPEIPQAKPKQSPVSIADLPADPFSPATPPVAPGSSERIPPQAIANPKQPLLSPAVPSKPLLATPSPEAPLVTFHNLDGTRMIPAQEAALAPTLHDVMPGKYYDANTGLQLTKKQRKAAKLPKTPKTLDYTLTHPDGTALTAKQRAAALPRVKAVMKLHSKVTAALQVAPTKLQAKQAGAAA